MQQSTENSGNTADSSTKTAFEHDEKNTLLNTHSNHLDNVGAKGSVMCPIPISLDIGLRSKGHREAVMSDRDASTVTVEQTAGQSGTAGAVLALADHASSPDESGSNSEASNGHNVLEKKYVLNANTWERWKAKVAQNHIAAQIQFASEFKSKSKITVPAAYDVVGSARALLRDSNDRRRDRKDTQAQPSTIWDYLKKCARIDQEVEKAKRCESEVAFSNPIETVFARYAAVPQTFNAMKSALSWRCLTRIEDMLAAQDDWQRKSGPDNFWLSCIDRLQDEVLLLDQLSQLRRENYLEDADASRHISNSKKIEAKYFGIDESKRFLDLSGKLPKYRIADLLLLRTGLRPVELDQGVQIDMIPAGVQVTINGGKVRETAGQPVRKVVLQREKLPSWFLDYCTSKSSFEFRCSPDGHRSHLEDLSDRVFTFEADSNGKRKKRPKERLILSAYVFRHLLVDTLRSTGWDTASIAAAIGERSEKTVSWYGNPRQGAGKVFPPVSIIKNLVEATFPVKARDVSGLNAIQEGKSRRSRASKFEK